MRRSELEPTQSIDSAAEARRAREVARARGTRAVRQQRPRVIAERAIVSINASYLTASRTFDDTPDVRPVRRTGELHDRLRRRGQRRRRRRRLRARVAGPRRRAWRSRRTRTMATSRSRAASRTRSCSTSRGRSRGLLRARARKPPSICRSPIIVPVNKKLRVVVFGGPSFFTVKQSVVTGIDYDEATRTTKPPSRARTCRDRGREQDRLQRRRRRRLLLHQERRRGRHHPLLADEGDVLARRGGRRRRHGRRRRAVPLLSRSTPRGVPSGRYRR